MSMFDKAIKYIEENDNTLLGKCGIKYVKEVSKQILENNKNITSVNITSDVTPLNFINNIEIGSIEGGYLVAPRNDIEFTQSKDFITKLNNGEFNDYLHNGICIETDETVYEIIRSTKDKYYIINKEYDYSIIFTEEESGSIKDLLIQIAEESIELKLWHSFENYIIQIEEKFWDIDF